MDLSAQQKRLLNLLSDGNFHSGSKLAQELDTTRASIWKQIKDLRRRGLDIAAVPGKGYRLRYAIDLLDETSITRSLSPSSSKLFARLCIYDELESTNDWLVKDATVVRGTVCLAESQTAGRGRTGRAWVSPFGTNIYLSLLWRYESGAAAMSGLSLAIGIGVTRTLRCYQVAGIGLKWPNDIMYADKKLGGILVEAHGDILGPCTVVVGLGLNCHMPQKDGNRIDRPWTDLEEILGSNRPNRNSLIAGLLNEILPIVSTFDRTGIRPYLAEWRDLDCMVGRKVKLFLGDKEIHGRVEGLNDEGLIVLQTESHGRRSFASGEISFHEG